MEIISRTRNGLIAYCGHCKVYQLEFGNLFFRLSESSFDYFRNYVVSIDGAYYEHRNKRMTCTRKIFLRLPAENVYFCVCASELEELKRLVLLQAPCEGGFTEEVLMHDLSLN